MRALGNKNVAVAAGCGESSALARAVWLSREGEKLVMAEPV